MVSSIEVALSMSWTFSSVLQASTQVGNHDFHSWLTEEISERLGSPKMGASHHTWLSESLNMSVMMSTSQEHPLNTAANLRA